MGTTTMSAETDTRETWTSGEATAPAPLKLDVETRKKNIAAFFASTASVPMIARCAGAAFSDVVAMAARAFVKQALSPGKNDLDQRVKHALGEAKREPLEADEAGAFLDAIPDEAILGMLTLSRDPLIAALGQGALNARMVELGTEAARRSASSAEVAAQASANREELCRKAAEKKP